MPIGDWQFWAATTIALVAVMVVLRLVVPQGVLPRRWRRGQKGRRTTLTVDGKSVGRR